jgi:hypothetical protein
LLIAFPEVVRRFYAKNLLLHATSSILRNF